MSEKKPVFDRERVVRGRKLVQFKESWMKRDFCYNKRMKKGEDFIFPKDSPIKQFRGQKYTTKVPVCEAHLKLSQPKITKSEATGWGYKRNSKFTIIFLIDILLTFAAEDFGLSFVFIADPWINFAIDVALSVFHFFLYDPYLVAFALGMKSLILIPNFGFGLIGMLPWHYMVLVIGSIQRKRAMKGILNFKNEVENFYGGNKQFVFMNLYPEPIVQWSKAGIQNPPKLTKLNEVKVRSVKSKNVQKPINVSASRIKKRFKPIA